MPDPDQMRKARSILRGTFNNSPIFIFSLSLSLSLSL